MLPGEFLSSKTFQAESTGNGFYVYKGMSSLLEVEKWSEHGNSFGDYPAAVSAESRNSYQQVGSKSVIQFPKGQLKFARDNSNFTLNSKWLCNLADAFYVSLKNPTLSGHWKRKLCLRTVLV